MLRSGVDGLSVIDRKKLWDAILSTVDTAQDGLMLSLEMVAHRRFGGDAILLYHCLVDLDVLCNGQIGSMG